MSIVAAHYATTKHQRQAQMITNEEIYELTEMAQDHDFASPFDVLDRVLNAAEVGGMQAGIDELNAAIKRESELFKDGE